MPTPLIAIPASHLRAGQVQGWRPGGFGAAETYVKALRAAGARPVLLTAPEPAGAEEVLEPFDGLLLTGGGDLEPASYGARSVHPKTGDLEPDRDVLELDLVRTATRLGLPVLGICRGMQTINVAFGGTLHQHLPDLPGAIDHGTPEGNGAVVTHELRLARGSTVADATGGTAVRGLARHHQAVDRLGAGLVATGWTSDGLVEAMERAEAWVVAVQWHPEATAATDPAQQGLFDAFVGQARGRRRPARVA